MAYNLWTGLIGSGDIDVNVSLNNLDAANIDSGIFDVARIPNLSANKITSDILALDRIPTIDSTRVPNLSANKITSDILALARIPILDSTRVPSLSANKITSDTLGIDRIPILDSTKIPNLDASKITSGTFNNVNVVVSGDLITTGTIPYQAIPPLSSLQGTLTIGQLSNITAQDYINIHGSKIDTGTITGQQLATDAVSETKILNGAVTSSKLASGLVPLPGHSYGTQGKRALTLQPTQFVSAKVIRLTGIAQMGDDTNTNTPTYTGGMHTTDSNSSFFYANILIPDGWKPTKIRVNLLEQGTTDASGNNTAQNPGYNPPSLYALKAKVDGTSLTSVLTTPTPSVNQLASFISNVTFTYDEYLQVALSLVANTQYIMGGFIVIETV